MMKFEKVFSKLSSIPGRKIVTWDTLNAKGMFDMKDDQIVSTDEEKLCNFWSKRLPGVPLVILVRQFTQDRDKKTGIPIKHISGFLYMNDERIDPVSVEELAYCCGNEKHVKYVKHVDCN